jgi:two-component system chemotaxis sensor kinase CheA
MYRRLLSVFSAEAAERIHRVNGALLALERGEGADPTEALTGVMRELHTLKGAGCSVNLEDVETLSHDLESVFGPALGGERELSHPIFAVAYRTLDAIGELIVAAVEERPPAVDVGALVAQMHAAADGSDAGTSQHRAIPADEDPADHPPVESADHDALLRSFAELQEPLADEHRWMFGEELSALSNEPASRGDAPEPDPTIAHETEAIEEGSELEPGDVEPIAEATDEVPHEIEPTTEATGFDTLEGQPPDEVDPSTDAGDTDVGPMGSEALDTERDDTMEPEPGSSTDDAPEPPRVEDAGDADSARARVMAVFATESLERVKTINRRLMTLERAPDASSRSGAGALSEILRELHTLKGSSAIVHVEPVESLAHQLEALFGAVRDGARKLDAPVFDIAYRALDAVETAVGEAVRGDDSEIDTDRWSETIGAAIAQGGSAVVSAGPPPAESFTEATPASGGGGTEDTVRLAISKLDALMGSVSELHVARAGTEQHLSDARALLTELSSLEANWLEVERQVKRAIGTAAGDADAERVIAPEPAELEELEGFLADGRERIRGTRLRLADLLRELEGDGRRLAHVADDLQDDVRRARMLPVSMVFDAFPRLIRDLAVELGKRATLVVEGADTEVDRSVIEQIRAPLTHLLRNAIDHGLERPDERERAGKQAEGTITLSASQRGDTLLVEVHDDGAGIDPNRIRAHAVERRALSQEAAEVTNDAEALRLIFRAGFSTRGVVTDLSGRGVGLDVVRDAIERLRGSVEVDSVVGQGTRFSLRVPLSVATAQCVMVGVSGITFALPISNVYRIMRLTKDQTERADGRLVVAVDGEPTPISSIAEVLGLDGATGAVNGSPHPHPAVVLASAERRIVYVVDELIGTQTLVLKSLPAPLVRLRNISGAAVLGTGEVVGVLNAADLVRRDDPTGTWSTAFGGRVSSGEGGPDAPLILVVDDSSVTRTMVKGILELAGFRVQVAADGMQAWELLRSRRFDLLVSDVNMPEMSGFDLTEKVRSDRLLRHVPVILVTALDSLEDQARGTDVGADAYITKGSFNDERLIRAVRNFV